MNLWIFQNNERSSNLDFKFKFVNLRKEKMQILLQLTPDPINIIYSNKYSIYDQFAHGVPNKKKKKKKQISFPTNNSHSQSKNRRLG